MASIQKGQPVEVTQDDARAGVTGHNVRYVLAFGLGGVIAAFVAIGIYFGYDNIAERLSQALAQDPVTMIRDAAPYALILALGGATGVLLYSLWTYASGPSENATQTGMRARVVIQFTVVCIIMAMLYLSSAT
jgi:uncharacterized membrane protein